MSRTIMAGLTLTALLAGALPAAAQDGEPTLEGTQWSLVSYVDDAGLNAVPFGVDASLLLEDGTASGSSGCNSFTGSYQLDGDVLTFDEALTTTLRACTGDADAVEAGYYAALPEVAWWELEGSSLVLLDGDFETILTYDTSTPGAIGAADLAALIARIDALEAEVARNDERIDNINIRVLRERLRALEADNQALKAQLSQLRASASSGSGSGIGFNAAEKTLMRAVPERFSSRCQPLRGGLPTGAAAAVACQPNTSKVAEMTYYLMEAEPAVMLFDDKMTAADVPRYGDIVAEGTQLCDQGVPAAIGAGGGYIGLYGCYRASGRANLRIVEQITSCKQLTAGDTRLARPVMYVALTGPDGDIRALDTWATRNRSTNMSPLIVPLGNISGPDSPDCFVS